MESPSGVPTETAEFLSQSQGELRATANERKERSEKATAKPQIHRRLVRNEEDAGEDEGQTRYWDETIDEFCHGGNGEKRKYEGTKCKTKGTKYYGVRYF